MSFPISPVNGQTAVVNNITYKYASASSSWTRVQGTSNSLSPTSIRTSAYTASVGDLVRVNSSAGAFTITLPASPADGGLVAVFDVAGTCGTNAVLIAANDKTVEGDSTGLSLNVNGAYIVFMYISAANNWKTELAPTAGASATVPIVLNDISGQFDGSKTVFSLKLNQDSINSIVDSKDLEVVLNGQRLSPYVDTVTYPWLTAYDSFRGFRVVGSSLIIYNAPYAGDSISLILRSVTTARQKRKYPYSATTIALGD